MKWPQTRMNIGQAMIRTYDPLVPNPDAQSLKINNYAIFVNAESELSHGFMRVADGPLDTLPCLKRKKFPAPQRQRAWSLIWAFQVGWLHCRHGLHRHLRRRHSVLAVLTGTACRGMLPVGHAQSKRHGKGRPCRRDAHLRGVCLCRLGVPWGHPRSGWSLNRRPRSDRP